ncbi:COG1470 family protein [Actinokineospora globicatena]|uniref:Hydrolytic protein n=1 Tax=Actinokineospora globicatena TaxID=103729 RepID=A0A9W6QEK3_9PSEU|nr:hypothetical protein [Actinokineospora globicatena]GLW89476.1 hypothetical protein Aglo03_02920 [Actinokineospora globicatena]
MGASATMSTPTLAVQAGATVTTTVVIRNAGAVVDHFTVDVIGPPAPWATVTPDAVNLLPDESTTVTVSFTPPRTAEVTAGVVPFGVRVFAQEDPEGSVMTEGQLEVGAFGEITAEVVPTKVEGASGATFEVAVDNRGNQSTPVVLTAVDKEADLSFAFRHTEVTLEPGTTAYVRLRVKPPRRFLRGQPVRRPFTVTVTPVGGTPVTADGTFVQRQLLPKWVIPALAVLLAFLLAIIALWFTVFKPAVRSAASDAAAKQAAEVKQVAQAAQQDAGAAKQQAGEAKTGSDRALRAQGVDPAQPPASDPVAAPKTPPPPPAPAVTPFDRRIAADAPIDADVRRFREVDFVVPDNKTLQVTDLILQNPRADVGTMRVIRRTADGRTLMFEFGLGNFRDLDHHWVQPLTYTEGESIILAVSCQNPPEKGNCTPAIALSGRMEG